MAKKTNLWLVDESSLLMFGKTLYSNSCYMKCRNWYLDLIFYTNFIYDFF